MPTHLKDGHYVAPLSHLKFKGDTILIPYGETYGQFLSYDKASKEYVATL